MYDFIKQLHLLEHFQNQSNKVCFLMGQVLLGVASEHILVFQQVDSEVAMDWLLKV
jgi:hypothetical protein